jgi:hypothetical protein
VRLAGGICVGDFSEGKTLVVGDPPCRRAFRPRQQRRDPGFVCGLAGMEAAEADPGSGGPVYGCRSWGIVGANHLPCAGGFQPFRVLGSGPRFAR